MKGLRPLACAGTLVVTLVSGCGGGGSSNSENPTITDNTSETVTTVTPGAVIESADQALVRQAVTLLKAFDSLRSLVFFGEALENGGQVSCLNGDRVQQLMVGQQDPSEIPTEGSVELEFSDCQISESLILDNKVHFEWTNFQQFESNVLVLDRADARFDNLEFQTAEASVTVNGPLSVSYSLEETGRRVKSSQTNNDEPFELNANGERWSVSAFSLHEDNTAEGSTHLEFNGTFSSLDATAATMQVFMPKDSETVLVRLPGEDYPRSGEVLFSTLENSVLFHVDSQESVTLSIDNGVDGSIDGVFTYSWEALLAL